MCIHVPLGLEKLKDNISPFRFEQTDFAALVKGREGGAMVLWR